ncbi:hypothetical protein Neosp_006872 [[Neocosmospora] mangrovei]
MATPLPNPPAETSLLDLPRKKRLPLLRFPNEIIHDVLSGLERKDLKAVRLSCRRICDIASAFLYETLYLSCHDIDLFVFEMVTLNPLLLAGVKELIIDDTTVSSALLDRRVYRELSRQESFWKKRRIPYYTDDDNETWDDDGRALSPVADDELHRLLVAAYKNHHRNRLAHSDVAALREALPGMIGLRTLVLPNRTADDTPKEGSQSQHNTSPLVKWWRRVGEGRRERPPFPPRVDWYSALEADEIEGDEIFEPDWLIDGASDFVADNGGGAFLQPTTEQMGNSHDEDDLAHSDDENDDAQEPTLVPPLAANHAVVPLHQTPIPLSARALRRQSRGMHIAIEVLRSPIAQSRLKSFRIDASLDTIADVETPGLSIGILDFVAPPFAMRLSMAFSTIFLTSFGLVLSNGREGEVGQGILEQGQLGSVLSAMPRLQHLVLEAHGMAAIGAIPNGTTFPDLVSAEFACGLVTRLEIRKFLRRHGSTLQHLRLLYCTLDDEDPSWSDAVQDIIRLQGMGATHLRSAVVRSGYETVPLTSCGRNRSMTRPEPGESVYSWALGVQEDVVDCPVEELGHEALPEDPQP